MYLHFLMCSQMCQWLIFIFQDIYHELCNLDVNKLPGPGPHGWNPCFFKEAAQRLLKPLAQKTLETVIVPNDRKIADVAPVFNI